MHTANRFSTATRIARQALCLTLLTLAAPAAAHAALAQDPKAVQAAKTMREKRASVDDIVTELQRTFRLDATESAKTLRAVGIDGADAAPPLVRVYRATAQTAAKSLRDGGYAAEATAVGLSRVGSFASRDVIAALTFAEYDPSDIQRVTVDILRVPASEMAISMKQNGATAIEVATVLKNSYGLEPAPAGDILLLDGRFMGAEVTETFRVVWNLDLFQALAAMEAMTVEFSTPWQSLENGGYEVVEPKIHRYRIADYRPGHSGQYIENVGVVDPDRITPINPDPSDGVVDILLGYRDLDNLEVRLGSRVGEILGREPHTFTADGVTWPGEWLTVRFRDFDEGTIVVERATRSGYKSAKALAYHLFDGAMLADPIEGMSITIGSPVNEGTVTLPGGNFGGIEMQGSSVTFEVDTNEDAGIVSDVVDFSSNGVNVTTSSLGDGTVELLVDISFETSGAEVDGTFLDYIPCWKCSTFEIPTSQCSGINIPCFLGVLAQGIGSLGTCANPDNWVESKMANGPALPFEADLTNPTLELSIILEARDGAFNVKHVAPKFDAGVTLRTQNDDLSLEIIRGWIMTEVNGRLIASLQELDLGGRIVAALEQGRATLGWGDLRGLWILNDGRWFLDASH